MVFSFRVGRHRGRDKSHKEQKALAYTVYQGFFGELLKGQTLSSHTSRTGGLPDGVVMEMVELFGVPYTSYFYYMRYARQYLALTDKNLPDYHTYVGSRQSHEVRKMLALLDFSLDSLRRTHEELYPDTPFDPSQPLRNGYTRTSEYYKLMYFPFDQGKTWDDLTLIQEMALYCNLLRDRYHASMVFKVWPEGGREVTYMLDTHGPPHNVVLEATARKMPGLDVKSYAGWTACKQVLGLK